jgi:hypothetical protein
VRYKIRYGLSRETRSPLMSFLLLAIFVDNVVAVIYARMFDGE